MECVVYYYRWQLKSDRQTVVSKELPTQRIRWVKSPYCGPEGFLFYPMCSVNKISAKPFARRQSVGLVFHNTYVTHWIRPTAKLTVRRITICLLTCLSKFYCPPVFLLPPIIRKSNWGLNIRDVITRRWGLSRWFIFNLDIFLFWCSRIYCCQ